MEVRNYYVDPTVTDSRQGVIQLLDMNLALTVPRCRETDMLRDYF